MINLDNKSRQKKFKSKMYNAGFRQIILWVKDKPNKKKLSVKSFIEKIEKLLLKFNSDEQNKMICLIVNILESKKEAEKLKEKKKNNMPEAKGGNKGRGQ